MRRRLLWRWWTSTILSFVAIECVEHFIFHSGGMSIGTAAMFGAFAAQELKESYGRGTEVKQTLLAELNTGVLDSYVHRERNVPQIESQPTTAFGRFAHIHQRVLFWAGMILLLLIAIAIWQYSGLAF